MGDLAATGGGRSYLAWVAENIKGNPGTAARVMLGSSPRMGE